MLHPINLKNGLAEQRIVQKHVSKTRNKKFAALKGVIESEFDRLCGAVEHSGCETYKLGFFTGQLARRLSYTPKARVVSDFQHTSLEQFSTMLRKAAPYHSRGLYCRGAGSEAICNAHTSAFSTAID